MEGVYACVSKVLGSAWRVGVRPIAALIPQLRQRAPKRASYPPWLLDGGAGARAFGSNQRIHAAVEVRIDKSMRLQELGGFRLAPIGAVARPLNKDPSTYREGVDCDKLYRRPELFKQRPVEPYFGHGLKTALKINVLPG